MATISANSLSLIAMSSANFLLGVAREEGREGGDGRRVEAPLLRALVAAGADGRGPRCPVLPALLQVGGPGSSELLIYISSLAHQLPVYYISKVRFFFSIITKISITTSQYCFYG